MSSKVKVKLNRSGVRSLLRSSEMQEMLSERAKEIQQRAGDDYEQDVFVGTNRANAMVSAATYQAKSDNMKNNTLLKAVK